MQFDLVLTGGTLVRSDGMYHSDLGIREGKIVEIGDLKRSSAAEVVDISGLHVFPGVIDTQVHFREPGLTHKEDLESGTRAAVHGGVTCILEMPNTVPNTSDAQSLQDKIAFASGRAWCNFGFFIGATTENSRELAKLEQLPGCPGIKIFMGSSTGSLLVSEDDDLRAVLRSGVRRCPIHAEDEPRNRERRKLISEDPHPREHPYLRDAESAILATRRILALSEETRRPVHVLHISTGDEPGIIHSARQRGVPVTCEVTPQHLFFASPDCYEKLGTLAQMNPPIRDSDHRDRLWKALEAGVFDVFGSDHAPHTLEEKSQPYPTSPSGMPGVQTLLPVLLTFAAQDRIGYETIAQMACERPAELYGMIGKGRLQQGFSADLTIVDIQARWKLERSEVQSKCGWSPYEGEEFIGDVRHVLLAGNFVIRDQERQGTPAGTLLQFDSSSSES
jgi:dihydroorotase